MHLVLHLFKGEKVRIGTYKQRIDELIKFYQKRKSLRLKCFGWVLWLHINQKYIISLICHKRQSVHQHTLKLRAIIQEKNPNSQLPGSLWPYETSLRAPKDFAHFQGGWISILANLHRQHIQNFKNILYVWSTPVSKIIIKWWICMILLIFSSG